MDVQEIAVQRVSVVSKKSIDEVLGSIEQRIGRRNPDVFSAGSSNEVSEAELQALVNEAAGPSGLIEFARFNFGSVLRLTDPDAPRSHRIVAGNPLVMRRMVRHIPDAGSYAPITILIDERADGVHLSYNRMASYLAPYGNPEALAVARELDAKVEAILQFAAA